MYYMITGRIEDMGNRQKREFLRKNQLFYKELTVVPQFIHPVILAIQQVEPVEDWDYRIHSHTFYELILPLGRPYWCLLNHQVLSVPAGSFLLIQPGQIHQDFYTKNAPFRGIHFQIESEKSKEECNNLFPPDFPLQKQIAKLPVFASKSSDLLFEAFAAGKSDNICNALFAGLFWSILEAYVSHDFLQRKISADQNIIQFRISAFFHKALESGNFSLKSLQSELQISARTLEHLCWKLFNNPPAKAFQFFRCQHVRKFLLEHPEVSLKETAELFHFNNQFSMSRSFRNIYGYPPSEVMKYLQDEKSEAGQ